MSEELENQPSPKRRNRGIGIVVVVILVIAAAIFAVQRFMSGRSDESYLAECTQLADAEKWEDLKRVASRWVAESEMPDEALIFLSEAHLQSGDPKGAVDYLLDVPARSSRSYAALITASDLQFGPAGDPLGGVETLLLMAQQKPSSVTTRQRLIFFYAVTLQREKMLDAIYEAMEFGSEPLDCYAYLLIADHLSFTNGFKKNSEWLEADPDAELFQVARMVQLIRNVAVAENATVRAQLDTYLAAFGKLREKYPKNPALLESAIERAIDDFDIETVEKLVAELPDSVSDSVLLRHTAWLRFQQGEYEKALELLETSLRVFALDWHTWHELAACRRRLGDTAGAGEAATIALVGKALRKEVMQLDATTEISPDLLSRIADYAKQCGDWRVETAARIKLSGRGGIANP